MMTLAERIARAIGAPELVLVGRRSLAKAWSARWGTHLASAVPRAGTLFVDGGLVLGSESGEHLRALDPPFRVAVDDEIVAAAPPPDAKGEIPTDSDLPAALADEGGDWPVHALRAPLIREPHHLVASLDPLIRGDLLFASGRKVPVGRFPGVTVLGDQPVRIGERTRLDPGTTLDARGGPIVIGEEAEVSFSSWVVGPAAIGSGSRLLGGTIGPLVAIGPVCRVRGEVAETIFQGHSNKAHDGFIGHSVIGEWVNLGAFTTCSDLKHNYGSIRVDRGRREVDTGLTKLGVTLGDHVKTAIGTLFTTGATVDLGASLFGEPDLSPRYVPPFAWGTHGTIGSTDRERFVETARKVMSRRDVSLDADTEERLRAIHAEVVAGRG
jgi:UDP-N-acetylglucosamine diphosphorylase/glucosamine-1-phosphate N-acetyltransferase